MTVDGTITSRGGISWINVGITEGSSVYCRRSCPSEQIWKSYYAAVYIDTGDVGYYALHYSNPICWETCHIAFKPELITERHRAKQRDLRLTQGHSSPSNNKQLIPPSKAGSCNLTIHPLNLSSGGGSVLLRTRSRLMSRAWQWIGGRLFISY